MKAAGLLGLILLSVTTFAAEESCVSRCGTFNPLKKCQCDSKCLYYGSCCGDFDTVCPKKIARGDTFEEPEEIIMTPLSTNVYTTTAATTTPSPTAAATTPSIDPVAAPCSGHPFDAFLQLKNGSIYAFRGAYFFELDDKAILPGYPKLTEDVWGISGPIDAAFTRINCQGKTYIFKGNKYWRFEGDVLDADYPREISVGFQNIPNAVDAAFAIPAPSHRGKEKAYFFKGDKYYQYEFRHQPSHEECVHMSASSPSVLFTQYTDLFCDQTWEDLFTKLFGDSFSSLPKMPRLISRDWVGIRPPVDAAMVGQVFLTPKPTPSPPAPARRPSNRRKKPGNRRGQQQRQSRQAFLEDLFGYGYMFGDYSDFSDITDESTAPQQERTPVQNVYFFKRDKYFRVDLQTKSVAFANPPYPRSIAKYWLGCKQEDSADTSKAEKK
ncbi:vitronectin b [Thalassophryne amazonica]|uniref:vitronectin b n=1 Tax=Thalassophryne amazonica TaxID=390379 RepID=UPI0014719277|nr:vitronectin b [Thalassophryne amazonica]